MKQATTIKKNKLKSYPRGQFELIYEGKILKGRITIWTLQRVIDKMKLSGINELFEKLSAQISFKIIAELLLCAIECECVREGKELTYTEMDAFEWLDLYGLEKIIGLIGESVKTPLSETEATNEKKTKVKKSLQ